MGKPLTVPRRIGRVRHGRLQQPDPPEHRGRGLSGQIVGHGQGVVKSRRPTWHWLPANVGRPAAERVSSLPTRPTKSRSENRPSPERHEKPGTWLIFFAIGSALLPLMGLQFIPVSRIGLWGPAVACIIRGGMLLAGIGLIAAEVTTFSVASDGQRQD